MYNKKIKKNIKADKKAKFIKKDPEIIETKVIELVEGLDNVPQNDEAESQPIVAEPVAIQSSEIPEIEIVEKIKAEPIKTRLKKTKDKNNRKKAKFTKKEIPKNVEIRSTITTTAAIDDEPVIIKSEPKPIDEPVIIHTPWVELAPAEPKPEKKENPNQIELYEYTFNNYDEKNKWTSTVTKEGWAKHNHPKLNTWIVDYFIPKARRKEWYKTVHYFSLTEITDVPPISPSLYDDDGC